MIINTPINSRAAMDFKLIGGILLIIGTSIGAGMLALPIVTAQLGFLGAVILLVFCWAVMTLGALLLLEVNLWLPQNSNLVSMAKSTIGPGGQIISWLTYLLLLYSLLCAYIAGGSDIFRTFLAQQSITIPASEAAIIFTLLLGTVVFLGIRTVDYTNRLLMFMKFGAYILLVLLIFPKISPNALNEINFKHIDSADAMMVAITSFGYAAIIPSIRVYFHSDIAKLKKAIFIGSLIPLLTYIIWCAVVMGVVPLHGANSLDSILNSSSHTGDLIRLLTQHAGSGAISLFIKVFTSVCMVTSFLGVGLCLVDFLADGLQVEKKGLQSILISLLTFLPPLIIVLFFPNAFIKALEYAGIYCVILLILLPVWMTWKGRYKKTLAHGYQVFGKKPLLLGLILFSFISILWACVS